MSRRGLAAACLVVLALSAGCSALSGEPTPTRDPYGISATPSPTATTAALPPDLQELANHERALRRAGNFTIEFRRTLTRGNWTSAENWTLLVDLEADRYLLLSGSVAAKPSTVPASGTVFAANGSLYVREGPNGSARAVEPGEVGLTPRRLAEQFLSRSYPATLRDYDLERAGGSAFDGELLRRYVATDPGAIAGRNVPENVTAFDLTVLVDHRGVLRSMNYTLEGRLTTGEYYATDFRLEIRDLGTTEVTRPGWVPNGTDGSGRLPNGTDDPG